MRLSDQKARIKRAARFNKWLDWHEWYAWYPVQVDRYDGEPAYRMWVWLETVERKLIPDDYVPFWKYRLKE